MLFDDNVDEVDGDIDQIYEYVPIESTGVRLDQFLSLVLQGSSRSRISASIKDGTITVDGKQRKNSYRLKAGECVVGSIPPQEELDLLPEPVPFSVLYEDEACLVVSKPPGIVVHPGSGNHNGTLVNGLLHHCLAIAQVGDKIRPGIVHRLDKDTSGVMIVAKTEAAHRVLVDDFKNRRMEKQYVALVCAQPREESGRIVEPIGRHPVSRQKMAVVEKGGRYAATNWEVVERFDSGYTLLRLGIETGRTHQIRVHLAYLGFPVAGDSVYGRAGRHSDQFPRQLLHAAKLGFKHPVTGVPMIAEAPLYSDFQDILNILRGRAA